MPAPGAVGFALGQLLGFDQVADPVRSKADAAKAAVSSLVGAPTPLIDVYRTATVAPRMQLETRTDVSGHAHRVGSPPRSSGRFNETHANQVAGLFGLKLTGAGRTDDRNRQVGGAANSRHLFRNGARARDFVGTPAQMKRAADWARANGADEVLIHNAGSGTHLHIGW